MYDPYTDDGLRKLIFAVHTPRDINTQTPPQSAEDTWLRNCLYTVYALYGYAPLAILVKLYNTRAGYHVTSLSLLQQVNAIPIEGRDFTIHEGQLFSAALDKDELTFLQNQGQEEYYVPTAEAISYATLGVMAFTDTDTVQRAIHSLEELTGLRGDGSYPLVHAVFEMLSHDQPVEDITLAIAYFQKLTSQREQDQLLSIVTWLDRRVPKLKNRGYTDAEREQHS